MALGKNRSFRLADHQPGDSVPIPSGHLETIFQVCHFTPGEKSEFLAAYTKAHTRRLGLVEKPAGSRP